jgi:2-haloacid dehalogenase
MCDIARRNDFHWDAILGADLARDFKPKPAVYLASADSLGLRPSECMMCAAHASDLEAAARNGLRTAFIARPEEDPAFGEGAPKMAVDIFSQTMLDLADQLQ